MSSAPTWDVVLSYAREDQDEAAALDSVLESNGYSVWWDRDILPSENWRRSIEDAIRQARCVVVLWTPHSVKSDWVLEEASLARERGKLVPVHLEDAEIPLSFRLIQMADLRGWAGDPNHSGMVQLEAGIRRCLGGSPAPAPAGPTKMTEQKTGLAAWRRLAWLFIPTLVAVLTMIGLMLWRVPADVDIQAIANRVQFHLPAQQQILLDSPRATSVHIQGFQRASIAPSQVWFRDPNPAESWKRWPTPPVELAWMPARQPGDESLTIQPYTASQPNRSPDLQLDRFIVSSADVTIDAPETSVLTVRFAGAKRQGSVLLPREFLLETRHVRLEGGNGPPGQSVKFRMNLAEPSGRLQYSSDTGQTAVQIAFPPDTDPPIPADGLAVDRIEFLNLDATNQPISSISGAGSIAYRSPSGVEPIPIRAGDTLVLGDLRHFQIRELAFAGEGAGMRLRMEGEAGRLLSGSASKPQDRRVSRFDTLWQNQRIVALLAVLAWLVSTLVAARKFVNEHKPVKSRGHS